MTDSNLLLIDGSSMLVRGFFATSFRKPLRQTSDGTYTNAVFGFLNMLFAALEQFRPELLLVAWDVSRDTFRREIYPAYKGTRGELPEEMLAQFDTMQLVLSEMGIAQSSHHRFEADDVLGTAATHATNCGIQTFIVTGDRDALQLVSDSVSVCIMRKGISELDIYTPELLRETWDLNASQIIDLKGLMGDSSDNIPGVPGIGEKTAKKLLLQYETLEGVYEHVENISGKLRERLLANRDQAFLSKRLATIVCDVPLPQPITHCQLHLDVEKTLRIFQVMEFTRMQTRLERFQRVMEA